MQKLTISANDLKTVVNYLYPKLQMNIDFGAIKFSDSDDIFFEWKTDKENEPNVIDLEKLLEKANAVKAQAEAEAKAKLETAEAKLAALGLTAEDLQALGLGGN